MGLFKLSNYRENRIIESILVVFLLGGEWKWIRIIERFELQRFELERVYCTSKFQDSSTLRGVCNNILDKITTRVRIISLISLNYNLKRQYLPLIILIKANQPILS